MRIENLKLTDVVSAAGLLSLFSLFVVLPYSTGYFQYYGIRYLSLFSLVDYYFFSLVPLVFNFVIFAALLAVWLINKRYNKLFSRVFVRRGARAVFIPVFLGMLITLGITFVFSSKVVLFLMIPTSLIIATIVTLELVPRVSLPALIVIFLCCEWILAMWGYAVADGKYQQREVIKIIRKDRIEEGRLIFVGADGFLLLDDNNKLVLSRVDRDVSISLGAVNDKRLRQCFDFALLARFRDAVGFSYCR